MKKNIIRAMMLALVLGPLSMAVRVQAVVAPNWDATGSYVIAFNSLGTDYAHDMVLVQDGLGNLTGSGGYPAGGAHAYSWTVTSGTVMGNVIDMYADYTAPADAVTPLTVMHIAGTIAPDGTMSGTWSDNYQGGSRSGSMMTTSGVALALGSLAAEDFGVMNESGVMGYTAGFGLTDATFTNAQSVVMELYSGAALLQTNTATPLVGATITGTQISSPFDVFGTFDYVADGYWTNVRTTEYGQTLIPTRVVATVTLENGKIVTAENTSLTGDPATIFPAPLLGSLAAEDFGVVNYNTGLGMLKGYSAGFGLTDATFASSTATVVQLYAAGDVLLQTNTATALLGATITGVQISSPFDVSGTFDYATDGYWINVREAQFGQSVPAVKVVATVTLANGKIVTATNTILVGDPTTIYPTVPPVNTPVDKNQCKKNGWKTFSGPGFKNQGQCVSYVEHVVLNHGK